MKATGRVLVLFVLALAVACGHHNAPPKVRALAKGILLSPCAVDSGWLYAQAGSGSLARISRKDGHVEKLATVTALDSIVPIDGTVYWLDTGGVHRVGSDGKPIAGYCSSTRRIRCSRGG